MLLMPMVCHPAWNPDRSPSGTKMRQCVRYLNILLVFNVSFVGYAFVCVCVCVFPMPIAQMAIWEDGEPVLDWGLILGYRRVWTC